MAITYRHATDADSAALKESLAAAWGGTPFVAGRGILYDLTEWPALIAERDGAILGVLTYELTDDEMYVISIHADSQHQGIGSGLMEAAVALARGRDRIWLTTTNDNLDAIRFYQRRGFRLIEVRPDAVTRSRALKPTIPLVGAYGIEMRDEIDLERRL
jgi:ribosomal protein S18 acetylase RimI-like enzyme